MIAIDLAFPEMLAAQKLSLQTLLFIGVMAGAAIVFLSYANWRRAVKTAFIILLIEGALRKWAFQSGQELVYFLKDVVLFGAYIRFFLAPDPDLRAWKIRAPVGLMALLAVIVVLTGMNLNIGSVLLAVYGIKIYLYYIPLAFMMPYLFRSQEEMLRQLCWYALLAAPICLLGVAQFEASADSPLNIYADAQETGVIGFGFGERTRVTGTFSFITGHTTFVAFFATLHLALLMCNVRKIYWWLLMLDLPLLLANGFMGGSRSSIITVGFIVAGFLLTEVLTSVTRNKNILLIFGASISLSVLGASIFFTKALSDWTTRATNADTVSARVIDHPLISMNMAVHDTGLVGYGIGMTHPAVQRIRIALGIPPPAKLPPTFDMEPSQVIIELGLIGFFAWYGLRLVVLLQCWVSFMKCPPGSLRSILLAASLLQIPYLLMSVVLNHTANFLLWACYGLTLIPRLEPAVRRRVLNPQAVAIPQSRGAR